MLLSEIINSKLKYETRFKSIDEYVSNASLDKGLINILNDDIVYMKYNLNHGYLKKVIKDKSRKLSFNQAYKTISNLQSYRNLHYNENRQVSLKFTELSSIVDGKQNYRWKDRLENLDNKLNNLHKGNLNDLDEVKYVLYCLENNKYLNSKREVKKIKKKVEGKLKKYIRKNKKRNYFMMFF